MQAKEKDVTQLKKSIRQLFADGQTNSAEFKKALSLLSYANQIEEHKLNTEKFWADIEKTNKDNTRKYFESEKKMKELTKQEALQERKENNLRYKQVINSFKAIHKDLIEKFLEVANRQVSIINEYGQPSWDYLYLEIAKFIALLAKEEGIHITNHHIGLYKRTRNPEVFIREYSQIAQYLEKEFKKQFNPQLIQKADLNSLSGVEFEAYVAQLLRNVGASDVVGTPITGDQGADLLFKIGAWKIAAQVKRHTKPIGNYAIQEIVGAIRYYGTNDGWVITNTTFTPSAIALAQKNDVALIDGNRLSNLKGFLESLLKYSAFIKLSI